MTLDVFSPLRMGALELPNRVVMAPMTRNRVGAGNAPGPLNVEYYRQRAGAGLIVTESTQVSEQGIGYAWTPGIHSPAQIAGWRAVTDAVHAAGGRIFCQLWHGGRISHPSLQPEGALPVAPSAISDSTRASRQRAANEVADSHWSAARASAKRPARYSESARKSAGKRTVTLSDV